MGTYILQVITPRAVIFNNEILSGYSIPNLVVLYLYYIIERTILLFHSSVPFHHSIPTLHSTDSRHPDTAGVATSIILSASCANSSKFPVSGVEASTMRTFAGSHCKNNSRMKAPSVVLALVSEKLLHMT